MQALQQYFSNTSVNIKFCMLFPTKFTTRMGFEPTWTESIELAFQCLNHSAISSYRPAAISSPRLHLTLDKLCSSDFGVYRIEKERI